MSLHVVQIGNVGPQAWAPFTTEEHLRLSLEALGHTVTPIMEGARCDRQVMKALRSGPVDMVLYTRTDGLNWDHQAAIACWDEARRQGIPTVSVHLDLFHSIARRNVKATRANALFAVDLVATADGDHDAEWAAAGINHLFLPPAVVEQGAHLGTPREEYLGNVGFVGSSQYHAEWPRRPELVRALENRYPDLVRGGGGVTVRDEALNDLYASAEVVAGDSLAPLREKSTYASDRITETPGRGGLLVHPLMDWWADTLGEAVVWCDWSVEGEIDKIEEVLSWSPEARQAHRARAVEIIRDGHLYTHRMQTVLSTVFG